MDLIRTSGGRIRTSTTVIRICSPTHRRVGTRLQRNQKDDGGITMSKTSLMQSVCAAIAALALGTLAAHAGVDISTKATQNMSCANAVCSPTAKKAVLNVNDVTSMLAAGDLKITTGAGALDIHVKAPFSWTSTDRLTLDAMRSITIEKTVTVAGTGGLQPITNDGGKGGDLGF